MGVLVVGTFWLLETFIEEIRLDLKLLNELSEDETETKTENLAEMKQLFRKIIQNYSDVKQLREREREKISIEICVIRDKHHVH